MLKGQERSEPIYYLASGRNGLNGESQARAFTVLLV